MLESLKSLESVTNHGKNVITNAIDIEIEFSEKRANGNFNVWLSLKDGKISYKSSELTSEELREIKCLAKKDGKWIGWKSAERQATDEHTAKEIHAYRLTETETGRSQYRYEHMPRSGAAEL